MGLVRERRTVPMPRELSVLFASPGSEHGSQSSSRTAFPSKAVQPCASHERATKGPHVGRWPLAALFPHFECSEHVYWPCCVRAPSLLSPYLARGGVCSCVCSVGRDSAPLYVCVWGARFFLIQRCSLKLPVPWLFLRPLFFYFRLRELGSSAGCFVAVFGVWATC